jgi:hypothetical protein
MKNTIRIIMMLFLISVGLTQCEKDKGVTPYTSTNLAMKGMWRVNYFKLNGVEHTTFYSPYIFEFKENNVVSASGEGQTIYGKWKIDKLKCSLDFGLEDPFALLNNDSWDIVNITASKIELRGKTGTDGKEEVAFKRME